MRKTLPEVLTYGPSRFGKVRAFKPEGKVFLDTDRPRPGNNIYFFAVVYEWKMYEEQTCKPRMLLLWRDVCKKASGIPFKCTDECQKLSMSYQIQILLILLS